MIRTRYGSATDAPETPNFATLLSHYRTAAGLTQEELSEQAGVSVRSISDMERGTPHIPRKMTVRLLAVAFDLSPIDADAFMAAARRPDSRNRISSPSPASPSDDDPPSNLPTPPTPLIGRERAIGAACDLLGQADVRLLTLIGPAGVGKTRLGLAVAARMRASFADGCFFVDLTAISAPDDIFLVMAQALGVSEQGAESLRERLRRRLGASQLLLILDNFEHLTAAARSVDDLLTTCPQVKALVTSRVALRVRGEHIVSVAPLPLPDSTDTPPVEMLAQAPSVALFAARARQVQADFALTSENAATVVAICRQLDGLPLAIELAATRLNVLPPPMLLILLEHRLQVLTGGAQDLPMRQQTLRRTLAWSYDLLAEPERALFRRLAIFVGGCTLETAEVIRAALGGIDLDILDGMTALVDHSLVRMEPRADGTARFTMLT